jgi:hypothetical protein
MGEDAMVHTVHQSVFVVTFNTEYSPAMLLFSNTLSNLLPKNIIIDMRTVELKLLKEIKDEKPKKKQRNK